MKLQEQDVLTGRYRFLRCIGSGGFSVVWLAADQITGGSEVALMIYVPEKGMDSQGSKMFVREYEIVADVNLPGLLKSTHFECLVLGRSYLSRRSGAGGAWGN